MQATKSCDRCGAQNAFDARFCQHCGQPFAASSSQTPRRIEPRRCWQKKRYWLLAIGGMFAGFVLLVVLVVNLLFSAAGTVGLPTEDDLVLQQIRSMTDCDELALLVFGFGEGRLDLAIEARNRWMELSCTLGP